MVSLVPNMMIFVSGSLTSIVSDAGSLESCLYFSRISKTSSLFFGNFGLCFKRSRYTASLNNFTSLKSNDEFSSSVHTSLVGRAFGCSIAFRLQLARMFFFSMDSELQGCECSPDAEMSAVIVVSVVQRALHPGTVHRHRDVDFVFLSSLKVKPSTTMPVFPNFVV